jgi:hypothetical protein
MGHYSLNCLGFGARLASDVVRQFVGGATVVAKSVVAYAETRSALASFSEIARRVALVDSADPRNHSGEVTQMRTRPLVPASIALATLLLVSSTAPAQQPLAKTTPASPPQSAAAPATEKTATQFYVEYRAALLKAKTIEAVLPQLSREARGMIGANTAAENKDVLLLQQTARGTTTNVLNETKTPDGVSLKVEGVDADKKKITWVVDVVKENGAWKVRSESFPLH